MAAAGRRSGNRGEHGSICRWNLASAKSSASALRTQVGSSHLAIAAHAIGIGPWARARWHEENCGFLVDRKSTRLNSSHGYISYAVFCLKKKKKRTRV